MKALFLAFVILTNTNQTFEIKEDIVVSFFSTSKDYIELFCNGDEGEHFVVTYIPANDYYRMTAISEDEFINKARLYQKYVEKSQYDDNVLSFLHQKYTIPKEGMTLSKIYNIGEMTISLIKLDDGHSVLNTFLVISDSDSFYIKNFDIEIDSIAVVDNYLLLIINNCPGVSIVKVEVDKKNPEVPAD